MDKTPLIKRLQKRFKHLNKWARKQGLTCFRVYHRDIPEFPCAVEYMDGDVVCWIYDRTRDETDEEKELFQSAVKEAVAEAFELPQSQIFFKGRQVQKGLTSQYEKLDEQSKTKVVEEAGLNFELNLSDYLDTGLFLDHRQTRALCRDLSHGKHVLNLFAYTGSFSVYARAGGAASTMTVDLSSTYVDWAKRNMDQNFPARPEDQFMVDDCLIFLKEETERYDLIICDPPTFSNSKKMEQTFSINHDYVELLHDCLDRLNPNGTILFSTNSRTFKLDAAVFPTDVQVKEITTQTVPEDFKGTRIHRCFRLDRPSSTHSGN